MFCGLTTRAGKVAAFDFEPSSGRLGETNIFDSAGLRRAATFTKSAGG